MSALLQCPDDATLRLLLLGQLADDDMEPLGSHLLACPACTDRADTLDIADALTVSLGEVSIVGESHDPLLEKLQSRLHHLGHLRPAGDADQTQSFAAAAEPSLADERDVGVTTADRSFSFLAPPQTADELGRLGPYRILRVLGQGGMGVVFQAEDPRLGRRCALKAMLPEMARKPGMKERFLREARLAAQIEHDHIIPIYQVDEDRGVPYIAMPLLKGVSLEEWLRDRHADVHEILNLARQIAEALAAAHDRGLIHRDIKPANVWLESRDKSRESTLDSFRVKILDFGLARLSEATGDEQLTQSGAILGTPSYMAPEQARGETVDGRADLFSLGVILYRLCTGTIPFKGKDTLSTLLALATREPPPPHEVNPAIPQPLSKLVIKLLAKERDDRLSSACELIEAIDALQAQQEHATKTTSASSRWKTWAIAAALLAMLGPIWFFGPGVYRFVTDQVVHVRTIPAPAAAPDVTPQLSADRDPFWILARDGKSDRSHANLSEAIAAAASGDTIEIRGNGPFPTPPLKIPRRLHLRSGAGFRPVIKLTPDAETAKSLIEAYAPLVLEGLEFQWLDSASKPRDHWLQLINASNALYAANCKFMTRNVEVQIAGVGPHLTEARNCEFLSPPGFVRSDGIGGFTNATQSWPDRRIVLDNCLLTTRILMARGLTDPKGAVYRLTHNTWRSRYCLALMIYAEGGDLKELLQADWGVKALDVHASDNVFDADTVCLLSQAKLKAAAPPGEAETLLARMAGWQGERNVYPAQAVLLSLIRFAPTAPSPPPLLPPGLAGWKQLWDTAEQGSVDGRVSFRGGDLLAKTESELERITPDDFRLAPDSAGYRAGADGKDLGADVDLVGPGPAYERWKQTPQYQQWLEATGQVK